MMAKRQKVIHDRTLYLELLLRLHVYSLPSRDQTDIQHYYDDITNNLKLWNKHASTCNHVHMHFSLPFTFENILYLDFVIQL